MEVLSANQSKRSAPVLQGQLDTPAIPNTETKGGDQDAVVVTPNAETPTPNPTPISTPAPTLEPTPTPIKEEPKKAIEDEWDNACTTCKVRIVAGLSFNILMVFLLIAIIYKLLKNPSE